MHYFWIFGDKLYFFHVCLLETGPHAGAQPGLELTTLLPLSAVWWYRPPFQIKCMYVLTYFFARDLRMSSHVCRGQRTTCSNVFSLSSLHILGITFMGRVCCQAYIPFEPLHFPKGLSFVFFLNSNFYFEV